MIGSRFGYYASQAGGQPSLLLDLYPNASAAYSLRKLRTAYSGSAIRVRETASGLNNEQDIGFDVDGNLDTAALLSFTGAGDGFVTTWYEQSGNGLDITNSTASNQPQIVSSGSIITEGGLPTIDFNGDYLFNASSFNYNGGVSIFSAFNSSVIAGGARIVSDDITGVQGNFILYSDSTVSLNDNGSGYNNISYSATNGNQLRTLVFNDSNGDYNVLQNGSSLSSGTLSGWNGPIAPSGASNIGVMASGNGFQTLVGTMQELIVWGNNQSANRGLIERNINDYYDIYPEPSTLLDDLSNVILAPSLNKISTAYLGNAVNVRESGGNTEQQIGFLSDNELDESALTTFTGANDGLVESFYDESGNGYDFVQTTAGRQPEIVNNEVVNKIGGKPTLSFGNGGMKTNGVVDLGGASELWLFMAVNITNTTTTQCLYETSPTTTSNNSSFGLFIVSGSIRVIQNNLGNRVLIDVPISTGFQILTFNLVGSQTNADTTDVYSNSIILSKSVFTAGSSPATYANYVHYQGARNETNFPFLGDISKPILLTGDQSANRTTIENNLMNYYGIS